MSNLIKHIPCEACGSSDGNSLWDDNHQHCFVCLNHIKGDEDYVATPRKKVMIEVKGEVKSIPDRGITQATCQHYGVSQDGTNQYYPYANEEGAIIASKSRNVGTKTFAITGDWKTSTLFGQNIFAKGGKTVTIHEGELEAYICLIRVNGDFSGNKGNIVETVGLSQGLMLGTFHNLS